MGTSVDFFPDGELQLTAKAQPTSGNPLRIEFTDNGKHVADFTIFTRSTALAVRLEHAINFVMQSKTRAVKRDEIEELIGDNGDVAFEAVVNERDQLYHHVEQLIGLVQLARAWMPQEEEQLLNENPRFADAVAYLTQIVRPMNKRSVLDERTAPEVAAVLSGHDPNVP